MALLPICEIRQTGKNMLSGSYLRATVLTPALSIAPTRTLVVFAEPMTLSVRCIGHDPEWRGYLLLSLLPCLLTPILPPHAHPASSLLPCLLTPTLPSDPHPVIPPHLLLTVLPLPQRTPHTSPIQTSPLSCPYTYTPFPSSQFLFSSPLSIPLFPPFPSYPPTLSTLFPPIPLFPLTLAATTPHVSVHQTTPNILKLVKDLGRPAGTNIS